MGCHRDTSTVFYRATKQKINKKLTDYTMAKGRPRFGTMGVKRRRAHTQTPRIRTYPDLKEAKLSAFTAYKVGMTHVLAKGFAKRQKSKNVQSQIPVTVLECPPVRIGGARLYTENDGSLQIKKQLNFKPSKHLTRKHNISKEHHTKEDLEDLELDNVVQIRAQIYTQPHKIGLKKKPEVFEVSIGGTPQDAVAFLTENIEKDIPITDVFQEGDNADILGITKGRGTQGPVKRFGIGLKGHKSEKGRRRPGSLGPWIAQQHVMPRVPQAGQTGYHQRTQMNNLIMKVSDNPEEINVEGGYKHYGNVKTSYILVKGSVPGPQKRLVTLLHTDKEAKKGYNSNSITHISTKSNQG